MMMFRSDKTYWAIRATKNRPGPRKDPVSGNWYPRNGGSQSLWNSMFHGRPRPRLGIGPHRYLLEPFTRGAPYRTGYTGNRR